MLTASYAKINLFLELLGRLPGNYHRVNTVLSSIDLFDSIKYVLTKSGDIILWSSVAELNGQDNLIYRIAKYLKQEYKVRDGVEIHLDKRIPIAAGLGGGSSNAANAIESLDQLWQLNLDLSVKERIAAMYGSDINFFLHGGTALGENRGERISPMDDIKIDNILLVNPGIAISAGTAYGAVELPVPGEAKLFDPLHPVATMFNRLEPAVRKLYPEVDRLLSELHDFGARKTMLSGSGSTCFGIFEDAKTAELCAANYAKKGYFTHITNTITRREYQRCFQS
ncbi:MAG: 4-(cytidine 5'-diphospho)-2-C-methyl-D-erythritol kinase [Candidatus Cloacimonadales bacterium]|jgi:4-diphosphocytidyl-2-C-methyl-D-erythritol kinase|nr:4-(cytidine 5'-diphospho)-2-C-methyl-D-erythritol kinase [Candidatus Cloacimonadota bacterium]MCB5256341.1 4-(cytidine 5'-diphospho)-2-C-methyl-D-erythritol kinase [Candidatus Cloacimonadota bacterium]MCB5263469.1 4-(cytidine 5'-diphospho)-2-C-methyl-D-erythritol kinase [Candidatus Cloacimonadota bacterium]MCB5276284.1 4-(cytidine 5'-diphospho)-2-C-methyl-D-erythritol kinase [Candidatus Cloacimonadota bacterium]MCK9433567.1 4-(cytidine 5'-diphospho)-2-C-methyl-D-erythritol kinase [Candidatus